MPTKPTFCLIAISSFLTLASCANQAPAVSGPDEHGIVHVPSRQHYAGYIAGYDEVKFKEGTLRSDGNPQDLKSKIEVTYADGSSLGIERLSTFDMNYGINHDSYSAFRNGCQNWTNCPVVDYKDRHFGIGALDRLDWMDSNIWALFDLDASKDVETFQTCRDDHFYGSSDAKTLMDVVDKLDKDGEHASSEPAVKKYELAGDSLVRRLPVCHWRQRMELDKAYPPPADLGKARVVPASHNHLAYLALSDGKGNGVNFYVNAGTKQVDKVVFLSPQGSATLRPLYESSDCSTYDRCEHFELGPEKKPDRFEIRTLDGEPLAQSRLFEVDDTVAGLKVYDGCAGGRLYTGKNRKEIEREIQEAIANPAPPPKKGAPVFGAPETSESGDTVIPDTFCDWAFRRQQARSIQKSQASQ